MIKDIRNMKIDMRKENENINYIDLNTEELILFINELYLNEMQKFTIIDCLYDFNLLIILSLAVVFLILTLSFGRIELGIICLIPLLISWTWTLGIMGLLGIRFNIFNVIIFWYRSIAGAALPFGKFNN